MSKNLLERKIDALKERRHDLEQERRAAAVRAEQFTLQIRLLDEVIADLDAVAAPAAPSPRQSPRAIETAIFLGIGSAALSQEAVVDSLSKFKAASVRAALKRLVAAGRLALKDGFYSVPAPSPSAG